MNTLNDQETALTMESAESSSEVEKKATAKLRQQQFMDAAANYSQTIHNQTNSSQTISRKGKLPHNFILGSLYNGRLLLFLFLHLIEQTFYSLFLYL